MKFDPSASLGVPAHITVNYPFLPGEHPTAELMVKLTKHFASFEPFDYKLTAIAHFSHTVYLAPTPVSPFIELIESVAARFPNSPPYGGAFKTVIPHLTVAQREDDDRLAAVTSELAEALQGHLPLSARAERVLLMDDKDGRWIRRAEFPLGR